MSIVYVMGHVLVTVGAIPGLGVILRLIFDFGGLAVIAVATGGIKPCVSAFAADQVRSFAREILKEKSLKNCFTLYFVELYVLCTIIFCRDILIRFDGHKNLRISYIPKNFYLQRSH